MTHQLSQKQSLNIHRFFSINKKMTYVCIIIKKYSTMFSYLLTNYNVLCANNQCIYNEYKICVLEYRKLKKMFKDLQKQNSCMKKELKTLKKDNDDEIRLIIENCYDMTDMTDMTEKKYEVQDYESENAYELV